MFLSQCTTRVASRAEMLGAINQVTVKWRGFVPLEGMGDISKNKFSEHFHAQPYVGLSLSAWQRQVAEAEADGEAGGQVPVCPNPAWFTEF